MLQYAISGGQLRVDKKIFITELLHSDSILKKLMSVEQKPECIHPEITKTENTVTINYNNASDVTLDEGFDEIFSKLKSKYKDKVKGKIVIRITALTSYYVVLDLNSDDEKVIHEH